MQNTRILRFHAAASEMTSAGARAAAFAELPGDLAGVIHTVQGLLMHEYLSGARGYTIPESRRHETHLRPVSQILDAIFSHDPRPLAQPRALEDRAVGTCRHFALLAAAMLRAKGMPARVRVGYGAYFNPGYFENHWVCEAWRADQARWVLTDPQFDEVLQRGFQLRHDVLDLPADAFVLAADAWARCRSGEADPSKFGIFQGDMRGLWFIAGDLVRDLAALNGVEVLPWDTWGEMPLPGAELTPEQLTYYDELAALLRKPDASFDALRARYADDPRLAVPPVVFNARTNRAELIRGC